MEEIRVINVINPYSKTKTYHRDPNMLSYLQLLTHIVKPKQEESAYRRNITCRLLTHIVKPKHV